MDITLETERLRLRPFIPADLEHLQVLDNDPEVMRFLAPISPEELRRDYLEGPYPDDHVAGIDRASGEFLGWFGIHPAREGHLDNPPGDLWLGYRLMPAAWGRGLATEGSKALIEKAFTALGASRVRATTMAVNIRSRRVMERSGLTYAGTYHLEWADPLPGTERGEVLYEVTRDGWERRRRTVGS
ncbi:MAG TPA: GNAT family N-acetyltransferase [Candidatus Dormibacteraeota bacterium]|nr:GNAT family N-acetyltransferase [Candidatus Dormibacteraeota bacterium]